MLGGAFPQAPPVHSVPAGMEEKGLLIDTEDEQQKGGVGGIEPAIYQTRFT